MNIFDDYGNFIEEHEELINKLKDSSSVILTVINDVMKVLDYVYEQYLAGDKIEEDLIDIFDIGFGYFSNVMLDVNVYYKDYFNLNLDILNYYGSLITYSKHLEDFKYYLESEELLSDERKETIEKVLDKIELILKEKMSYSKEDIDNFEDDIKEIMPYHDSFKPVYSVFLMITEELNIF